MDDHVTYSIQSPAGCSQQHEIDTRFGLSHSEVLERRAVYGLNKLDDTKEKSNWRIFVDQFRSLLTLLLVAAASLSFLFDDTAEGVAIVVVIFINALIGFWAESKATRSMAALRRMGRTITRVKRDGQIQVVPAEELVPGDIVILEAGDIVAADVQLIESVKLQCDESLLTGESMPVSKVAHAITDEAQSYDHSSMSFKGTAVTRGSGLGVALKTGKNTELGHIATLADEAVSATSPLEKRLQKLSEQLLIAVIGLTVILILIGIAGGRDTLTMIKTGIALAVAAIPEGLPIVATLALARGMWKLAERNALIERLSAVETLGSVTVVLTDKTGTLTENKMTATRLVAADNPDVDGFTETSDVALRAVRACALCYSGVTAENLSDPMEAALVNAAESMGHGPQTYDEKYPRVYEEAFDPNIRMMATIHRVGDAYLYIVKGAPETVLANATCIAGQKSDEAMTDEMRNYWLKKISVFASGGLRILALAEKTTVGKEDEAFEGLTFLGFVCLEDPPRIDAKAAVSAACDAGIRVVMATGDNAVTARSIAAAVGISADENASVIQGSDLIAVENHTVSTHKLTMDADIFARMSPKNKLDLIEFYQRNGAVVAMTGDGVNDAPALKKADVGISMGMRGTEVAKEAADMILRDDSFASIIVAIQQGRVIFTNIRKFVIYLMSCNLSEVLVVAVSIIGGMPLPLLPLQILFLNFVTDVFPALALGFGSADSEILNRPPRPKSQGLIQPRHWYAIIFYACLITVPVLFAYNWALERTDQNIEYANTVAFLSLALGQLWQVFNMRSRKAAFLNNHVMRNPFVGGAVLLCLGVLSVAIYWPPLASVLHITQPDTLGWIVITLASLTPLVLGQLAKLIPAKQGF